MEERERVLGCSPELGSPMRTIAGDGGPEIGILS